MAEKRDSKWYFINWCKDCKRVGPVRKLHGSKDGGTFECSDLTCPAHRRVNGMFLDSETVRIYVVKDSKEQIHPENKSSVESKPKIRRLLDRSRR